MPFKSPSQNVGQVCLRCNNDCRFLARCVPMPSTSDAPQLVASGVDELSIVLRNINVERPDSSALVVWWRAPQLQSMLLAISAITTSQSTRASRWRNSQIWQLDHHRLGSFGCKSHLSALTMRVFIVCVKPFLMRHHPVVVRRQNTAFLMTCSQPLSRWISIFFFQLLFNIR